MKSILKEKRPKLPQSESASQSNSIGAVRWTLPDHELQAHSSAPTNSTSTQRHTDLRDLRSLQECVNFISQWKQEVEQICKHGGSVSASSSRNDCGATAQSRSAEHRHRLILQWASDLKAVDTLFSQCEGQQERGTSQEVKETEQRIMEWAKELQTVSECGMMRGELAQTFRQLELKKKKLEAMLPFLEFITWSLLKHDQDVVSQLWLLSKQQSWRPENSKYIPNSVWNWICSAAAEVTLDPMTNHPWLLLSDDCKRVQESLTEMKVKFTPQRFDTWPCVLAWEGFSSGRRYWEVELANKGYWRVGVATASSNRQGRFPMSPCEGFWVLWRSTRQFYACTKPETPLPLALVPRKVGIYLDYEEGQLSFYNVEKRSHIYTFIGNFREKLYPLFAPLDGRTLITLYSSKTAPETH
ncbi:E3 ubiquitin-protein ligase TRIM39 isoform X2 [Electrophorus electricus]|uniref:E3 ubiquitin-protein ligase TRIM39 isoform X2 n=1 Tax=Electrophorus electricus TaxID=8005 RepID=UPI0015CFA003|nr:E3 ubiquitin-protein ligase TRIM39 isoform X2 [Electrophorus electricus]